MKKGSVSHQFVTVVQVTCLHQDTSRCLRDLWLIRYIYISVNVSILIYFFFSSYKIILIHTLNILSVFFTNRSYQYVKVFVTKRYVMSWKLAVTRVVTRTSRWIYGFPADQGLLSMYSPKFRCVRSENKNIFFGRNCNSFGWKIEEKCQRMSVVRQKIVNDVILRLTYQDYSPRVDLRSKATGSSFRLRFI